MLLMDFYMGWLVSCRTAEQEYHDILEVCNVGGMPIYWPNNLLKTISFKHIYEITQRLVAILRKLCIERQTAPAPARLSKASRSWNRRLGTCGGERGWR